MKKLRKLKKNHLLAIEGKSKADKFKDFCDQSKSVNVTDIWKIKKALFPKKAQGPHCVKYNHQGKLVSDPDKLQTLLGDEYGVIRLRKRPTDPKNMLSKHIRKKIYN